MTYTEKKQSKKVIPTLSLKKVIQRQEIIKEKFVTLRSEEPTVRYLKLYPFYRESKSNCFFKPEGKIVPELRLCGNWLEKAGFLPEEYVSVTVSDGLLVIRSTAKVDTDN